MRILFFRQNVEPFSHHEIDEHLLKIVFKTKTHKLFCSAFFNYIFYCIKFFFVLDILVHF